MTWKVWQSDKEFHLKKKLKLKQLIEKKTMTGFKNRLIADPRSIESSSHNNDKKQLKGSDLAKYIEAHKDEFKDDGDALCVSAGYGEYLADGSPACNFEPFVKELGKVIDLDS